MIILRSLGTAEIETAVSTLTPSQEVVFAAALYMILERGKRVSRARLASLLWPSVAEKARAHRLRQTVLQLKKLGIRLVADRDNLQLTKQDARSDSDDLALNHPALSAPESSLEFLPGYTPRLSEGLRDWVDAKRTEVHAAATSTLVHELDRARHRADWITVDKCAAACLALDPYNETAILAQAEAAAMRGEKRKAMSMLDAYIADVGTGQKELHLPATLLRRRIVERVPDRPALLNTDPPFVGRERETEILTRRFNEARAGKGSATILIGDPGIGKSRLCAEVVRFAELQGAQVQRAACRRTDVDRPLSLFADIVPQLREMPGALGCAPESFAALKRLTQLEERPQEVFRQADSEMLFYTLRTALFDLVDSVCEERSLFVLIEDVQWLDEASAKILLRMFERCQNRRLFFLLNARTNPGRFLEPDAKARLNVIALGPLMTSASETLLHSLALRPGDQPQTDFVRWCLSVAEGNPFFLQELAHQWIETGQRHEAPPSISRVLEERLSRLSIETLQFLQTSAVLGEYSTLDRIEKLLECPSHRLLSAIEELASAAMLRTGTDTAESSQDTLQPCHDFLSSAALNRLHPVSLAFLHRRAADVLDREISHAKMQTTLLWACANHRHLAGDRTGALTLSTSCAEHLLELGLADEACRAYERSLSYCVTSAERLKLLPRLALGFELAGKWEESKRTLRNAIQLFAADCPENSKHNDYELLLLEVRHRSALDFTTLLAELVLCVGSPDGSPSHRVRAAVIAMKVAADFGRVDSLDAIYGQILPLLHDDRVSERARLELEIIYRTDRGDGRAPVEELERFANITRKDDGEFAYSRALLTAATACRRTGQYTEGLDFASKALEHAVLNKFHSNQLEAILASALLHVAAGAFEECEQVLRNVASNSVPAENSRLRNELHCVAARVALELGKLPAAVNAFDSIERGSPTFSLARKGYYLALEIRIRIAQGITESIAPLVAELEETHETMSVVGAQDFEAHALCLGLAATGQAARGVQLLGDYVQTRRKAGWPLPRFIRSILESERISRHQDAAARNTDPRSGVV